NQMEDVIRQLEAAAKARGEAAAAKNEQEKKNANDKQSDSLEKAQDSHQAVLDALQEMAARFDAVKTLDQAADRFEEHARTQLQLHLRSNQAIRDMIDDAKPDLPPTARLLLDERKVKYGAEMKNQGVNQHSLYRKVDGLIKQVQELGPKLNA